jgi:hypothetical protein
MSPAPASPRASDAEPRGRYEQLRRLALGEANAGLEERGLGLALLMRRGLRGWLEATSEEVPMARASSLDERVLATDVRGELVRIVASMALSATRQEARR